MRHHKKLGLLGSTGSIGCNTIKVIKNLNDNDYNIDVIFLTTNKRIDILAEQVSVLNPQSVFIQDQKKSEEFKSNYHFRDLEILSGDDELLDLIKRDNYEVLLSSVVGFSGLKPTIEAIKSGKKIALANKETLVVAGSLVNKLLKEFNTELIPIDSEHSAILQCIKGEDNDSVSKIILTASGGPFRNKTIKEIRNSSVSDALAHPNWNMGNKITIDSATLMNKGLEVIEAKWLFDIDVKNIDVIIHPQSIIHSMVEFIDGSVKAQLGIPDMKIPIQYAITYPERISSGFPRVDFNEFNDLTFEKPDFEKFECLDLAFGTLKEDGTYPVVLNAANEVAVDLFLNNKIGFLDIPTLIKRSLDNHKSVKNFELEHIFEIDRITRKEILNN
ncbi:MAG: 1-deoxy-D-xylulose-5-phosphate reductoisomerase [Ignavibacteria bacterium]|nr:1-deoxy-D-xylulose-5-phosphate reductoisomerase [Ignavibacteria bacterium]